MNLRFRLLPLKFLFQAVEPIAFPAGQAGNIVRGALGSVADKQTSLYKDFFEPTGHGFHRRGYRDSPRPFVLRVRKIDGRVFAPGEQLEIGVHLFRFDEPLLQYVRSAFEMFNVMGLGPQRAKVKLTNMCAADLIEFDLVPLPTNNDVFKMDLEFLTPTELKSNGGLAAEPSFRLLFERLRDRISTLSEIYGDGPLAIDFKGLADHAARVETVDSKIHKIETERRSSRTGQTHSIGGFVGSVCYRGCLDTFMPYLQLGQQIGVGRQTTWGKGEIAIKHILRLI